MPNTSLNIDHYDRLTQLIQQSYSTVSLLLSNGEDNEFKNTHAIIINALWLLQTLLDQANQMTKGLILETSIHEDMI